jgi:hypothetical protein
MEQHKCACDKAMNRNVYKEVAVIPNKKLAFKILPQRGNEI